MDWVTKQPPEESRRPFPPKDLSKDLPPTPRSDREVREVDKGHGRLEVRTLQTTSILTQHSNWRGLSQGFQLTRERTLDGKKTIEITYGATSLRPDRAGPAALLGIVRDHWNIENELHYVRDVTFKEDACRVRSGSAPQVSAALRNVVVHLLAGMGTASHPEAIALLQIHPNEAEKLIEVPQNE